MSHINPRVDAYIASAADFAKPILIYIRNIVHKANPDVTENIKWGMPSFEYKGKYCYLAAFKKHVAFGFWKYKLLDDPNNYLGMRSNEGGTSMGNLGKIRSNNDLPPQKILIQFLKQAKALNDANIQEPKSIKVREKKKLHSAFKKALAENKNTATHFASMSIAAQNDYIDWIDDAKTEPTRTKRIQTAIIWIGEGKRRNWKYDK